MMISLMHIKSKYLRAIRFISVTLLHIDMLYCIKNQTQLTVESEFRNKDQTCLTVYKCLSDRTD